MKISPIPDTRILKITLEKEVVLAVADLHLGITAELAEKGIEIPSRVAETQKRLLKSIRTEEADRLFLLGDIKHNIPVTSWEEWENLPDFFDDLSKETKVEIVPGNHDGDIAGLISRDVTLHKVEGTIIGGGQVGLIHGHAWPSPDLMRTETVVMGHNHPAIELRDRLNARTIEPAWIRAKLRPKNLPEKLRKETDDAGPDIIIVPAFNKLIGGGAINQQIPEKLLGPLFKANAINLSEAEISLLDGTIIGKLNNLED